MSILAQSFTRIDLCWVSFAFPQFQTIIINKQMAEHSFSHKFESVLSRIVAELKQPKDRPRQHSQFYQKPYTNCKDCLSSRLKCKRCLTQLAATLKSQGSQRRTTFQKHKPLIELQEQQAEIESIEKTLSLQTQPQERIRPSLSQPKRPTLHQRIIQLPLQQSVQPSTPFTLIEKFKSVCTIPPKTPDDDAILRTTRLSIQTIQPPISPQKYSSCTSLRMNNPPRNSKLKPIVIRRKDKQPKGQNLLPMIRQLSIQDRQKTSMSKKYRTILNFRKKQGKNSQNGFGDVGAWERDQIDVFQDHVLAG